MKKEWTKPKLISLYRGRPEEAVLAGCKVSVGDPAEPTDGATGAGCTEQTGGSDCTLLVST